VPFGFDFQILTPRLLLRPPRAEDAQSHFEAARESLGEVGRWLSWCKASMTLKESEDWVAQCRDAWQRDSFYNLWMFERQEGRYVGSCGINEIDSFRRIGNLGYWIRTSRQGCGYATEAATVVAQFGFDQLEMMRLEIVAAAGNMPSRRVATKLGAQCEGLARNRLRVHGVQHDAYVFSLIPGDLPPGDLPPAEGRPRGGGP
jgi:RimJ/RimL family protein N-acetyltransferase